MNGTSLFIGLLLSISLAGCIAQPQTRYHWENYDNKLYSHYKDPADSQQFLKDLKECIDEAEIKNKIPPGLYGEYGYALFEAGQREEAVTYFQKEAEKWPESRVIMEKMIKNARTGSGKMTGASFEKKREG